MKKITFLLICFLIVQSVLSQGRGERIKVFKTGYITQELDLTPEEAEKFWPVYNAYEKRFLALRMESRMAEKDRINTLLGQGTVSEKQVTEVLQDVFKNDEQIIALKKELYRDLKPILAPEKLLRLYRAEMEFNRKLLSEFRRRGPGNQRN